MSELWTPTSNESTDVGNIFDMMLVFQDQLEVIGYEGGQKEQWYPVAMYAVQSLAHQLSLLSKKERMVQIDAEYAWVEAVAGLNAYVPYGEIGLRGELIDVHGSMEPGDRVPQISVALFAENMFSLEDPDLTTGLQMPAITPITKIRSVERTAA